MRPVRDGSQELVVQPGLADSGIADDGDELAAPFGESVLERRCERRELIRAADHRGILAALPAFSGLRDRDEPVGGDWLRLPFELERLDRLYLDRISNELVREVAE
ncbi:MAG: hypothetical protein H0U82_00190 [Actinobacteria bacterium]|nr:hypothetical protein [Actinomycetota bacterium]